MKNKETLYVHVTEDYVNDFTNVKITVPDEMMNYKEHLYHEFIYTLDSPNRFVGGAFFLNRCY